MTLFKHHSLFRISILGLCVALAACAVGPDYVPPPPALPVKWISSTEAATNENAVEEAWWQKFHDPVLDRLILMGRGGNLDLKIAEARIAEARAARSSADAGLLPSGNLGLNANRQANRIAFPGSSGSGFGNLLKKPFNTFQTGFDASWELDLFGGHRRDLEAASAALEGAEATGDAITVSLLAEIAHNYMEIRQYQSQLAIAQTTIASYKTTSAIARQRFQAGGTAGIDVTQAEALVTKEETQIPYFTNLIAATEFATDVLLGQQPGATHALTNQAAPIPAFDRDLVVAAPAVVIANRPDIRAAERKLAAATAQQGVAVAKFFPDISLTGFFGLLNTNAGQLLTTASKSWAAGTQVLWPILSYGTLSANLDAANAQQQQALAEYQKSILTALSDVERALTAFTEQQDYEKTLEKAVKDNRHATDISRQRYKEGLTSFLEVLDGQRTLYASEIELTAATAQTAQDLIAVYKSVGGGWRSMPAAMPLASSPALSNGP